jgi:phosphotransferase system enzyme I (PtsP)
MTVGQIMPTPRRLLARVRDVMAGGGAGITTAEDRLDEITGIIAADLVAEVCSVYVLRAGEVLELFATRGLKPEAVHQTRLRIGEGIIGDIAAHARPLALADAPDHPHFVYRPETGEEIYHSLMGVPILRGGKVIGVVAVQNRNRRRYSEEEVETLQTVAMVLAELVAGGGFTGEGELGSVDGIAVMEGLRLNAGLGAGVAVLHQSRIKVEKLVAEDPKAEHQRLRAAVAAMHGALDDMLNSARIAEEGEHRDVLETYRMIAEDAGWLARVSEAITSGLTAEAAVQKVHNDVRARMAQVTDPYLRERVDDLDDLANRLLQHLTGADVTAAKTAGTDDFILIARSMGPAQLLDYGHDRLKGLILEEGTPTAHVAIVARALDIPVIGNVRGVLGKVEPGDPIIVDGDNGQVFLRPGDDVHQAFRESMALNDERKAAYAGLKGLQAVTLDGETISLKMNAGLLVDLPHLEETGADGIGLYRTEIPFMVRSEFPDVKSQCDLYEKILEQAKGKPVVFRTLDVGGDKVLSYGDDFEEKNPAMGWRAIRMSLDRPKILREQLRALIRAAAGRELDVMFPMISEVSEFTAARALLEKELARAKERGGPYSKDIRVGVMLEVPALLFQLPELISHVDFISVGSNDLLQFLFASDRGNPRLVERYDCLSPPVLDLFSGLLERCRAPARPISICGEMAGRPVDAMALIGLGFRELSMSPPAIGPVKMMIRSLALGPLREYMDQIRKSGQQNIREKLRAFAVDHGVII